MEAALANAASDSTKTMGFKEAASVSLPAARGSRQAHFLARWDAANALGPGGA